MRKPADSLEMSTALDVWSYRVFGGRCFAPRAPQSPDLVPVAWERIPNAPRMSLVWPELDAATAEGLILTSLAIAGTNSENLALVNLPESLRHAIESPLSIANFAGGAKLYEISPGLAVLPPYRVQLQNANDCEANARFYAEQLISLAARGREDASLRESVELTLLEVFTNAYEHGACGYALLSASVGRADRWFVQHMVEAERRWLQHDRTKRVLEITVGDLGPGVPAHLERNFVAAVAPLIRQNQRRRTSRIENDERWRAHTAICRWAFEHYSTSKEDVRTPTASLNWRGLHRALAYAAWHDGFIALTSGYARTGFATYNDVTHQFDCRPVADAPVPGTLVTIRHLLRSGDIRASSRVSRTGIRSGQVGVRGEVFAGGEGRKTTVAVLHPFEQDWLHGERRAGDVELLRMAPPSHVSMHYFTDVTPDRLAGLMAESGDADWSRAIGSPRLIGVWTPADGVMWTIAGAVPKGSLKWFGALARGQSQRLPNDPAVRSTLDELARQYPEYVLVADERVSLTWPDEHTADDLKDHASSALLKYARLGNATYEAPPAECVLLTDNTKVQRYFSLTALVDANETLCEVLGYLLASEIDELTQYHGSFSLVTATLASYYLARRLLRIANRTDVDVHFLGSRSSRHSTAVLFQTATRTGRSLRDATLRAGTQTVAAIVGVDLGVVSRAAESHPLAVRSLLSFHFDPLEIGDDADESNYPVSRVICTVSDWPVRAEEPPSLTSSAHADRIVRDVPEVFSAGLQVINSRVHSVALPGAALVARRPDLVEDWLTERITSELARVRVQHVTIICRRESSLYERLPIIADRLYARTDMRITADRIALPSVQFSGHSAIFANVGAVTPRRETLHPQATLTPPDTPDRYCVVYLDTAAVTGKNMRASISMLPSLPASPSSFCVFVVTDRLSPRDTRFLANVQLRNPHSPDSVIELRFDNLFRLQVGSHEHLDTTPAARLIHELDAHDVRDHDSTAPYVTLLRSRLSELAHAMATGVQRSRAFGHLFSPDDDTEVLLSADAILFRHTLALFHQNEPVMTTLRTLLHHLVDGHDTGLLSMLAVEPNLVRQPPLLLDGWADIRAMASRCLYDENASTAALSDALAVVCLDAATAVAAFRAVASAVNRRPELMAQLKTFLARLVRIDAHAGEQFLRELAELAEPSRNLERLLTPFLRTRMQMHWPGIARLDTDALGTLYDFVKTMFPHSPAYNVWRDADSLLTMSEPPVQIDASQVIQSAVAVARRTLLPVLRAVRRLARDQDDLAVADSMGAAHIVVLDAIEELSSVVSGDAVENVRTRIETARKPWTFLRQHLIVRDPFRFLGSTEPPSQGAIESAMRKYFAMPELLIAEYVSARVAPDTKLDGPLPAGYRPLMPREGGAWVAPVGYQAVLEIARLAVENHLQHGVPGTFRLGIRPIDTPSGTELHFVFTDTASPVRSASGGFGIGVIRDICRRWGLADPQHQTVGNIFVLLVRFVRCAFLSWDQERSDEILHN